VSTASSRGFDIYQSDLATRQLADDALDYRRSLYTNTKADHPDGCPCARGYWDHGFSPGAPLRAEYDPCGPGIRERAPEVRQRPARRRSR
jgi:hypothetical protein